MTTSRADATGDDARASAPEASTSASAEGARAADATADASLVHLMTAYQAGRLDAFEQLYACLAGDVRRYFAHVVRDPAVTADLVQETFLEMHRSRRTYAPPLPVRPWVFGIARHVRWRHRRVTMRRARHEDAQVDVTMAEAQAQAAGAAPAFQARASSVAGARADALVERREIDAALAELPASRREAWVLHHVHGFSFQEIAARLRIGVGAAKLRSSRAMRSLRARFGVTREGGGDD